MRATTTSFTPLVAFLAVACNFGLAVSGSNSHHRVSDRMLSSRATGNANSPFDEVLSILQQTFQHSCMIGTDPGSSSNTTVICTDKTNGIKATFEAVGGPYPVPDSLMVCVDIPNGESCNYSYWFEGMNPRTFVGNAMPSHQSPTPSPTSVTPFDQILEILQGHFHGDCAIGADPGSLRSRVTVACSAPDGSHARFEANGPTSKPKPSKLKFCKEVAPGDLECKYLYYFAGMSPETFVSNAIPE